MKRGERGQVLIVVILILLVVSVIVLAVASRSVTDIKISQTSEESARAFSAAEAGVEAAVERINSQVAQGSIVAVGEQNVTLPSGAVFTYEAKPRPIGLEDFLSPTPLSASLQTLQILLSFQSTNYDSGEICLLWGDSGSSEETAIEAILIYDEGGTIRNSRFAIGNGNGFTAPNNDPSCNNPSENNNLGLTRSFRYKHKLGMVGFGTTTTRKLIRLRLLGNNTAQYVGVDPLATLPAQGYTITSTGNASSATRRVEVFRSLSSLPTIFDFVLFSGTDITK